MWLRDIPTIIPILAAVYLVTVYLLLLLAERVTAGNPTVDPKTDLPLLKALLPKPSVSFPTDYAAKDETTQIPTPESQEPG